MNSVVVLWFVFVFVDLKKKTSFFFFLLGMVMVAKGDRGGTITA